MTSTLPTTGTATTPTLTTVPTGTTTLTPGVTAGTTPGTTAGGAAAGTSGIGTPVGEPAAGGTAGTAPGAATAGATSTDTTATTPTGPTAADDAFTAPPGATMAVSVTSLLANDTAPPGDSLHVASVSAAQNGTATLIGQTGYVLFQPSSATFQGPAQFQYTATGASSGATTSATAHITYSSATSLTSPVAGADTANTAFGQAAQISAATLLGNDKDTNPSVPGFAGGQPLALVEVLNAQHGTAGYDANSGTVTFTPDANFAGNASFQYVAADGAGLAETGTVTVTVAPPQITTQPDTVAAAQNTATGISAAMLLANDKSAAANDPLKIGAVSNAQHGTASLDNHGDVVFTPDNGFTGAAGFTYQATDQFGGTADGTVTVNVAAPVATPDGGSGGAGSGSGSSSSASSSSSSSSASAVVQAADTTTVQQVQQVEIQQIQQVSVSPTVIVQQPPSNAPSGGSSAGGASTGQSGGGQGSSTPPAPSAVVYFDGTSQSHGSELWSYNGQGVGEVADINSGNGSSFPAQLQAIGGILYFSADDGTHGREAWSFDGQQTRMLGDIAPGSGSSNPQGFTQAGSTVYFSADDGTHGRELWAADQAGVHLVGDIDPGSAGSNPVGLTNVNGTLYFSATSGSAGQELWKVGSDGKPVQVADINPGAGNANPGDLTGLGGTLYFTADDGSHGRELFALQPNGTLVEQVVNPSGSAFAPPSAPQMHDLVALDNTLYFVANSGQGVSLYSETAGGTPHAVASLGGSAGATLTSVQGVAAGHDLYFAVADSQGNSQLARYDTSTGTLTANIAPDNQSAPAEVTAVGNQVFFTVLNHNAIGNVDFRDLYTDNGQATQRVELGGPFTLPQDLTAAGNSLFFADHGQLEQVDTQSASLTATTLTVAGGQIYVPLDVTAAHPDTGGMLGA